MRTIQKKIVTNEVGELLRSCIERKDLSGATKVYIGIADEGLLGNNVVLGNTIINAYIKCGGLVEAHKLFDGLSVRDAVSWNTLITGYAKNANSGRVLSCFYQMLAEGVCPNEVTFLCVLKSLSITRDLTKGHEIHAYVVGLQVLQQNNSLRNGLVDLYVKTSMLDTAVELFNELPIQSPISRNMLITGYVQHGYSDKGQKLFQRMHLVGLLANASTYVCIIKACSAIGSIELGQKIHGEIVGNGSINIDLVVNNALIDMYIKCGSVVKSQEVFDRLHVRDIISWNALIAGYVQLGHFKEALSYFEKMQLGHVSSDRTTYLCILKACTSIGISAKCFEIHSHIARERLLETDTVVSNALLDMYMKCGHLRRAEEVFHDLPDHNMISWNALLSGYVQHGHLEKALELFERMQVLDVSPDAVTFVCILKACGNLRFLDIGQEVHTQIVKRGLIAKNILIWNVLVDMYAKCSRLLEAKEVFDQLPFRNMVSWNTLIGGYAQHGHVQTMMMCFEKMQLEGFSPDPVTFVCLLNAISGICQPLQGQQMHSEVVKYGILEDNAILGNALINMYAKCGKLTEAQDVFEKLQTRNVISWNVLIAGYAEHGNCQDAITGYEKMQSDGVSPDLVTLLWILKTCGSLRSVDQGQTIHSELARDSSLLEDLMLGTAVVDMYAKCGEYKKAREVFDGLPLCTVVSWSVLIAGCAENGDIDEAFRCFQQMQLEGLCPDIVVLNCIIKACGMTHSAERGQKIHSDVVRRGLLERDNFLCTALIDMYAKCGMLMEAQEVFYKSPVLDTFPWNALIAGYVQHEDSDEAINCYEKMLLKGFCPDMVTFILVLNACSILGTLSEGQETHDRIIKFGQLEGDIVVGSALVDMYAKCGVLLEAEEVFFGLPAANVISWSMLMGGYVQYGYFEESLNCFKQMQCAGFSPDAGIYVCILKACSSIGVATQGLEIHGHIITKGFFEESNVGNALVDMYAKCGMLNEAWAVFECLPMLDVVSWNTILAGYSQFGETENVFNLFCKMVNTGIEPNSMSFTIILTTCSHTGLMEICQIYMDIVNPDLEHHSCVIDHFARAGLLNEAAIIASNIPIFASSSMWNTMLGACSKWGNKKIGSVAFENALQLNENNPSVYISMSNIHAYKEYDEIIDGCLKFNL